MTTEAATREAKKLTIEAALALTRLKRPMRKACMLVLLDGKTNAEAARKVGMERQHVYRALRALRPKLAEIEAYIQERVANA